MKERKINFLHLLIILIFNYHSISFSQKIIESNCYIFMFYNVENYFDIFDDIHTNDNEFLPSSPKKWDEKKFNKKTLNIFKVIASVDSIPPAIIGLAEVENRYVVEKLFYSTPLQKYPYKIIHKNSPDKRGIDVAMVYRSDITKNLEYKYINVFFPSYPRSTTRDILLAKQLFEKDTLFIFICHFPSRIGGAESEYKRLHTSKILLYHVDSLLKENSKRKILIMGDFNDEPTDKSINIILKANCNNFNNNNNYLINTMCLKKNKIGTIKYRGNWYIFDQAIINNELFKNGINQKKFIETIIFAPDFILMPDNKFGGVKPFPTYDGSKYLGGYSDHLPVITKFCN